MIHKGQKDPLFQTRFGLDLYQKHPPVRDITIHIAGKEDHEVLACGRLIERAAARAGLETLSEFISGEERGEGDGLFKLKVSESELFWLGEAPDLLIRLDSKMSSESKNRDLLPPSAALIFDCSGGESEAGRFAEGPIYPVPMARIAEGGSGEVAAKGLVALGAASKLFCFPSARIEALLSEGWTVEGVSSETAIRALQAGFQYAAQHLKKSDPHFFPLSLPGKASLLLSGNEAGRLGALAGGCRLFFVDHHIRFSPREAFGGRDAFPRDRLIFIDGMTIESFGQVCGAAFSGAKVVVETTGESFERIHWLIGSSRKWKIPVVVVDFQKKISDAEGVFTQADLNATILAGHSEASSIVIAPSDVGDALFLTTQAICLAEQLRMPVFILSDETLCRRTATVRTPEWSSHESAVPRVNSNTPLRPRSGKGGRYRWIDDRFGPTKWEGEACAEIGFISWGATQSAVHEAMGYFNAIGFPAAALYPKVLWPPPTVAIKEFAKIVKKVVVVEGNREGQFARMVRTCASIKPFVMTPSDGNPITPADLIEKEDWHGPS